MDTVRTQTKERAERLRQLRSQLTAEDHELAKIIDRTVQHLDRGYWPVTEPEDVTPEARLVEPTEI